MADLSGVSSTGLELLLEFESDLTDTSANGRDQASAAGAELYVSDGAVSSGYKVLAGQENFINTGVAALGSATLNAAAGTPFTVAMWLRFKGDTSGGKGVIVSRQTEAAAASRSFNMIVTGNNQIAIGLRGAATKFGVLLHDEQWHQVAATWDGTTAKVYHDGVAIGTPPVGSNASHSGVHIFIGAFQKSLSEPTAGLGRLNGQLDDLRIYSRALNASEINLLYKYADDIENDSSNTQTEDLELHLEFDDEDLTDSSANALDQTGNVVDGDNAATDEPEYITGRVGSKAARFDGEKVIDTGSTDVGDASLFATSGEPYTVTFWFRKPAGVTAGGAIVTRGDTFLESEDIRISVINGSPDRVDVVIRDQLNQYSAADAFDGEWHHVAVTWNGTAAAVYYDGTAQSAPTVGAGAESSGDNILIGGLRDGNGATAHFIQRYTGDLDDLRIYSRALSQTDIDEIIALSPERFSSEISVVSISGAVASMQIVFGDTPTSFVAGDLTVSNGSVSNVAGSGTTYTFDVTAAADGQVDVSIAADTVLNSEGIGNAASGTFSFAISGVSDPTATGLLRFDRTAARTFDADITIGPVRLTDSPDRKAMIRRIRPVFGSDTDATGSLKISADTDAEAAVQRSEAGSGQYSQTIASLQASNHTAFPRIAGNAAVFQFTVTAGHLVFESMGVEVADAGRNRGARFS
jgi:hypothetical protein